MKTRKLIAFVIALTVVFMSIPTAGFTVAAAESSLTIVDTNSTSSIKEAGFTSDSKNVNKTKYSAVWKPDEAADIRVKTAPTDFSKYGKLTFSIKAESTGESTIMVYFGSENKDTDGIDYYQQTIKVAAGEWQDVSVDLAQLSPNRTPLGWGQISELSFRTKGWTNSAPADTVFYIENIALSGEPVGAGTTATPTTPPTTGTSSGSEENAANINKAFYYNNFDDKDAGINGGAAVAPKTNSIEHKFDSGDNGYVSFDVKDPASDCYMEASLKSTKVNNLVVEMDVSTLSSAPTGNLQYKDTSSDRKQGMLFSINDSGAIVTSDGKSIALKNGTWVKLGFILDFASKTGTTYVDGKKTGTFKMADTSNDLAIMRMYISGSASNVDKNLLIDNFAVYGGTELRDISEEYKPGASVSGSGSASAPTTGEDVAMSHPSLDDINGGVALMLDIPDAYAKNTHTKVDIENDAVVPFTVNDRTLVPVRFISESFDANVDWSEAESKATVKLGDKTIELVIGSNIMYINGVAQEIDVTADTYNDRTMLPLRALVEALGKNVLWDPRGLIVITNSDVTLDPVKDVKLSTMLIGELQNGVAASNYAVNPSFTQSYIDEACAASCGAWKASGGNSDTGEKSANIMYYLTLAARANPNAAATDGTLCKDAVLEQVRYLIAGGHEPYACVGCYWGHAVVASALLLIKNSPVIYDELTADEKDRMDWLMRALAIAGNWGFNDKNNYSTGFDLLGNFGKTWNPNFRNTYLSVVVTASMYFGAEKLDKIYTSFDYDTYINKFTELGYTNILTTWKVAGKELMENGGECTLLGGIGLSHMVAGQSGGKGAGVKIPFLYNGMGPDDVIGIFKSLADYTFSWKVRNDFGTKGTDDYTYILSGKTSPFEGQMGMMREFAGSDGGSGNGGSNIRSRCTYGYDSYEIMVSFYSNMKLFGGWDSSTDEMRKLDNRIYVGIEDLLFKMQEGYHGFSSGKASDEHEYGYLSRGHKFVKDMWKNYHCMLDEEVTVVTDPNAVTLQPVEKVEPKDGVTTAPDGALKSASLTANSSFPEEAYYSLGSDMTKGSAEFDVVVGPEATDDDYDCVIMIEKSGDALAWSDANMLVQFKGGFINVRNGAAYINSKIRVAANYRYHIKIDFDVTTKKYSVAITPTYPTAGATTTISDYDFRTGAHSISSVDSIVIVQSSEKSNMWIENFKVTQ